MPNVPTVLSHEHIYIQMLMNVLLGLTCVLSSASISLAITPVIVELAMN